MLKRFRIVGLCLVTVFAMSAVGVSSASAARKRATLVGVRKSNPRYIFKQRMFNIWDRLGIVSFASR